MTKFILHGGMTSVRNENNKRFFEEVVKDLPENPKILISLFATEEGRWEEEYKYQKENFICNLERDDLEFQLASKENFMEQLKWANIVHFRGGKTLMLLDVLKKFPDFRNNLDGKTISGSSAGACFLVDNFYENDILEIHEGLGIVPVNLITHHGSEQYPQISDSIFDELNSIGGKNVVLIKETEFKIYEI